MQFHLPCGVIVRHQTSCPNEYPFPILIQVFFLHLVNVFLFPALFCALPEDPWLSPLPVALALPPVLGPCPSLLPQAWHLSLLHSRCTPFASLLPGCRQPGHGQHRKDGLPLLQGLDLLQSLDLLQLGSHGNERSLGLLCSLAGACWPALRAVLGLPLGKRAALERAQPGKAPGRSWLLTP